ncbi:MAG: STAS domain-containing protein [Rhodoferax sp.]|nr:STAS domain-containing protein [Rhodoferax sp.]MCF8208416.1 STAS domain-containing protein [Rhodoferax sp.]
MLRLPEELTHSSANACLALLKSGLATEAMQVEVDAQALNRFDSSALAVLLEFARTCQSLGKTMTVRALPSRLHDLATLYGVDGLLAQATE